MKFSDLVSYTKTFGKPGKDTVIVISSFRAYELVLRQLSLLAKQTTHAFDVLLVLGIPFEDTKLAKHLSARRYPFSVTVTKENKRRGCSGAFFTGQKYALEKGYAYCIMADDDCLPVDRKLIASLLAHKNNGYVVPTTRFVVDGYRKQGFAAGPTQYSLYSTEIFRKYGLYYLPLYQGADDGEYMERVKETPFHIANYTEHPYISGMRIFSVFDRSWVFTVSSLVIMKSARSVLYTLLQLCFFLSVCLFFLPSYGRRVFAITSKLLFTHTYGKKAHDAMKTGYENYVLDKSGAPVGGFESINETRADYIDDRGAKKFSSMIFESLSKFRKDVMVENTYSFMKCFFLAMFCRKLYVKINRGKFLLLADNHNVIAQVVKIFAFLLFLPAYALLAFAVFIPIKIIRQPKTFGYGLK